MMVFLPATRARLQAWRAGSATVPGPGFAATPAMTSAHDYRPGEEEAEYAALTYAGVASLRLTDGDGDRRWVAAAEVAVQPARELAEWGAVSVPVLQWADVHALFTDEEAARPALARLAGGLSGRSLAQVLSDDELLDTVAEHDLLWYAPTELDRIL